MTSYAAINSFSPGPLLRSHNMSYDLVVWYAANPVEPSEAGKHSLIGTTDEDTVSGFPRMQAFFEELTLLFPALNVLSQNNAEKSPWSFGPELTDRQVRVYVVWSRSREMAHIVRRLAEQHGLVFYDLQTDEVAQPVVLTDH